MPHILGPSQYGLYSEHLKRLNQEDRYLRFNYHITDQQIEAHVVGCALESREVFCLLDSSMMVVAALEMAVVNNIADVGLTVEEHLRGKRLGTYLFELAVAAAKYRGLTKMYSYCMASNRFMAAIARKNGLELHTDYGETTGSINL